MKTSYEDIVRTDCIGKSENPILMNDILKKAESENLIPSDEQTDKVLFIAVDVQHDFIEGGSLGVPGASEDVRRMTRFIYKNAEKISNIAVSLDTHTPYQVFHPCWWADADGNSPEPFTMITLSDMEQKRWMPRHDEQETKEYLRHLDEMKMKKLCIWPYHCIQGTIGAALENQFANMVYFHSTARNYYIEKLVKGEPRDTEFYGIIRPEYDPDGRHTNRAFLGRLDTFSKIVIAGEAMDYCVYESIKQILAYFPNNEKLHKKLYILEDCTSSIQDRAMADKMYENIRSKFAINIVRSTDDFL